MLRVSETLREKQASWHRSGDELLSEMVESGALPGDTSEQRLQSVLKCGQSLHGPFSLQIPLLTGNLNFITVAKSGLPTPPASRAPLYHPPPELAAYQRQGPIHIAIL